MAACNLAELALLNWALLQVVELTAATDREGVKKLVAAAVAELGKQSASTEPE